MKSRLMSVILILVFIVSSTVIAFAAENKPIEISVQDVWADSLQWGKVWLKTIDLFEKNNPNIKINRIYVPLGQNIERILLGTKTKSLPEVITCDTQDIPHLAEAGALFDLTQFVNDWGKWDDVFPGSQSAVTWKDKPYAMQFSTNTLALHYNKDFFEEAGLSGPPETWDDLLTWAEKLTKGDRYGYAYSAFTSEEATWHFESFLWSNGGDLLALDTPESISALEFHTNFVKKGFTSPEVVNWNQGDVGVQFRLGKTAMMIQGCWDIPSSVEANMNFDITKIPVPKAGMPTIAPVGGEPFGISPFSSPEKQKAAWEFLRFLMEETGMEFFNTNVYNIPTRKSIAPSVIENLPLLEAFLVTFENARNRFEYGGGEKYPNVSVAVREAIQKAVIGEAIPEEAFKEAAVKIKELMQE